VSSDSGKTEKPAPKPAIPAPAVEAEHAAAGTPAGTGLSTIADQRRDAASKAIYRMSGGTQGTPPLANLVAQRGAPIRDAVSRIMRKASGSSGAGDAKIPQGGGSPLGHETRAQLEPKLGADLSSVRVHTGGESQAAASHYGARAFAVGNDVHFNAGEFNPGTKEGMRLIGHEMTHVVQGQNTGVQRKADDSAEGEHGAEEDVSQPGEPAEVEADAMGDHVADSMDEGAQDKKPAGNAKGKKGEGAEGKPADGAVSEKAPPKISAKLQGIGPKRIMLAPKTPATTTPSRDQPLFDKLKSLGSSKPDKAVDNILNTAPSLKAIVMSGEFDACPGYLIVIGQLQVATQCIGNVPVLSEAKRMKAAGFKIEFEKTKPTIPKYDVDFAAIDPVSGAINAFAVKSFDNLKGGFRRNLFDAGNQLVNFQGATQRSVSLACRGKETLAQLQSIGAIAIADFKAQYPTYALRIIMSDGEKSF